ncbi:sporulation protein YtxC [Effusibacillus consociatus]|uniref:Sporulation protein YtxC n=1 Tax=Effusibacillus consociatus TaxID=1117041 RepID=A0ABV9PXH3_9BACL
MNRYAIGTAKLFDQLAFYLERELRDFRLNGVEFTTGRSLCGDCWYYTIQWKQAIHAEKVQTAVAKAVTDFLTLEWEQNRIRKRITKEYTYYDADEVDYLTENAVQYLSTYRRPSARLYRQAEIERDVFCYVRQNPVLHVEGFIRFRLRHYSKDLDLAIEQAIDQYLMDREYQEFVKLLRHFLSVQQSRSPLIHLVLDEGWTRLVDHDGFQITDEDLNRFAEDLMDADLQQDDMIISTLITLAPLSVKIHLPNRVSDDEVLVDTVKRVFEERVTLCSGCTMCQTPLECWDQNGHFPLDYSK